MIGQRQQTMCVCTVGRCTQPRAGPAGPASGRTAWVSCHRFRQLSRRRQYNRRRQRNRQPVAQHAQRGFVNQTAQCISWTLCMEVSMANYFTKQSPNRHNQS